MQKWKGKVGKGREQDIQSPARTVNAPNHFCFVQLNSSDGYLLASSAAQSNY